MSKIKADFDQDKEIVKREIDNFLKNNPFQVEGPSPDYRNQALNNVREGKIEEALKSLEKLRDVKNGIIHKEISTDKTPILIRDARNCKVPSTKSTEAFEMQYLNIIRAGMDIVDIENKPELKTILKNQALIFMNKFHEKNKNLSQKDLANKLKEEAALIAEVLISAGIGDAYKKLNVAKDFQNFKDTHANIVTISTIKDDKKSHTIIEAEVGLKGLIERQKEDYKAILDNNKAKPAWFEALLPEEQALCKKYSQQILDGKHIIPTQLRQIVGMKNAFEKITGIYDIDKKEMEILHTSKHAGTLTSLARDKNSRQAITDENARQAQEWVGKDHTLHCNTFNSGPKVGAGADPEIVKRTTQAMRNVGGKETNTAFNSFRMVSGANDLTGIKDTIKQISESLGKVEEFDIIKSHLKPRGLLSRTFGINKPKGNIEEAIDKLLKTGKIDKAGSEILRDVVDLKKAVEKADVPFRIALDRENINLQISTKLNFLAKKIEENPSIKGLDLTKFPKEEILNMCASGKDRSGLAMHNQTALAIGKKIGMGLLNLIDRHILASGHTAQQAGGVFAGGATVGCFGTKSENKAGIPKSREAELNNIMEVSAGSNKVTGKANKGKTSEEVLWQVANVKENALYMQKKSSPPSKGEQISPVITPSVNKSGKSKSSTLTP